MVVGTRKSGGEAKKKTPFYYTMSVAQLIKPAELYIYIYIRKRARARELYCFYHFIKSLLYACVSNNITVSRSANRPTAPLLPVVFVINTHRVYCTAFAVHAARKGIHDAFDVYVRFLFLHANRSRAEFSRARTSGLNVVENYCEIAHAPGRHDGRVGFRTTIRTYIIIRSLSPRDRIIMCVYYITAVYYRRHHRRPTPLYAFYSYCVRVLRDGRRP